MLYLNVPSLLNIYSQSLIFYIDQSWVNLRSSMGFTLASNTLATSPLGKTGPSITAPSILSDLIAPR